MPRNKAAVEAFHNGGVGGGAGCMCYTCHKVIRNPGQIVPCERCVLPFCSAKCMAVHRMDARECDLRAKIRESGGIVGLGNAGKQTAGAGRDFSKLAASFLQDRMEMILLQASLIGEDVRDCVIVVNLDDEESSAMTIPIDSYNIGAEAEVRDADNDAHMRYVLERNRKAGGLTAMCHDGHSCLMKTLAHPPGKADCALPSAGPSYAPSSRSGQPRRIVQSANDIAERHEQHGALLARARAHGLDGAARFSSWRGVAVCLAVVFASSSFAPSSARRRFGLPGLLHRPDIDHWPLTSRSSAFAAAYATLAFSWAR